MESEFQNHINRNLPFIVGKKLLLAVSGGLDSIAMVHLFRKLNQDFAMAHCNFRLRDAESDADHDFVQEVANDHSVEFFSTTFDTLAFAVDFKLSTQQAARKLRYQWFYELAEAHSFDYILTAHHSDDNLETFLINLSRGTGIKGLTGIPEANNRVVRPLLPFSRAEILQYAEYHKLNWREDSSNKSDKYVRNKIRQLVVPALNEVNPNILTSLQNTQHYLRQTQTMADDAAIMVYQQVAQQANDEIHFNLKKLKQLPNYKFYLYHWLQEFGFTAWNDIYALADAITGKQIFSEHNILLRNRDHLILGPRPSVAEEIVFTIDHIDADVKIPIKLALSPVDTIDEPSNTVIFVDLDKLAFPLEIRKWIDGDVFYPIGMGGDSKKVSKLFKDQKLSQFDKAKTWLLCSKDQIIWVIGIRADERFKITDTTKQILKITLQ